MFLYNQGDRQGAATRLITFRKNFDSIVQGNRREVDPEVSVYSSECLNLEYVELAFFLFFFN